MHFVHQFIPVFFLRVSNLFGSIMFPGQIFSRAMKVQSLLVGVQLFLRDRAGRREWQVGDPFG